MTPQAATAPAAPIEMPSDMSSGMPIDMLIERPSERPSEARRSFAEELSTHRPYLVRFARRQLSDFSLVEDVVQETLLAALQGAERFEHKASPRTWLTGILLRRIADGVRLQSRRPSAQRDDGDDDEGAEAEPSADAGIAFDDDSSAGEPVDWVDPQRRLENRQFIDALAEDLQALPPIAARLFALREIDGLSNEEAASALGLTPGNSAVLHHRVRARLRDALTRRWSALPASRTARSPSNQHALA